MDPTGPHQDQDLGPLDCPLLLPSPTHSMPATVASLSEAPRLFPLGDSAFLVSSAQRAVPLHLPIGLQSASPLQRRCPDHLPHQDPPPRCLSSVISSCFLSCTAFLTAWVRWSSMFYLGSTVASPQDGYVTRVESPALCPSASPRLDRTQLLCRLPVWALAREQRNWSELHFTKTMEAQQGNCLSQGHGSDQGQPWGPGLPVQGVSVPTSQWGQTDS